MGIIRSGLVFFVGVLLLSSLIIGNVLLTINLSLNYENVRGELADAVKKGVNVNFDISAMQMNCQNNLEYTMDSRLYDLGSVSVPCDIVAQGKNSVLDYVIGKYIEKKYYQEYNCNLFNCPLENIIPFVYVSQHAKNYWNRWFYYSLFASLILAALMFLLIEKKKKIFFNVGTLMIISSLPLLVFNWLVSNFNFANILFSEAKIIFWIIFILGMILVTIGIGLNFWKFNSEEKEEVSEKEIVEEKEIVKEKIKIKKK